MKKRPTATVQRLDTGRQFPTEVQAMNKTLVFTDAGTFHRADGRHAAGWPLKLTNFDPEMVSPAVSHPKPGKTVLA